MSESDGRTYGVTELAGEISRLMNAAFPAEVWVRGQIRNLSRTQAGHVYFDLVEPAPLGERPDSLIPVTLFNLDRQEVNRTLTEGGGRVRMNDGVEIRLRGRVQWYGQGGRLQIRMSAIDLEYTLGRLAQDRDRLLAVLTAEGLLARNGLLPVSPVPLRVGLITSAGSAAAADFLHELEASGFGWQVVLADARIQGTTAEESVVRAFALLATRTLDVIALVRGGGARTDLATFDREGVARAIAASPVPVFTGIGHEVDNSVADLVAAHSSKTPTACAAVLVALVQQFVIDTDGCWTAIAARAERRLLETDRVLVGTAQHVARATRVGLTVQEARTVEAGRRIIRGAPLRLTRAAAVLDQSAQQLHATWERPLLQAERNLHAAEAQARAFDPVRSLARGWSITRRADGSVVRSVADVSADEALTTTLADGVVTSAVTATESRPPADPSPTVEPPSP